MKIRIIFLTVSFLLTIDHAFACDSLKIGEIEMRLEYIEAQKLGEQIHNMRDEIYGLEGFVTELQNIIAGDKKERTLGEVLAACEEAGTQEGCGK